MRGKRIVRFFIRKLDYLCESFLEADNPKSSKKMKTLVRYLSATMLTTYSERSISGKTTPSRPLGQIPSRQQPFEYGQLGPAGKENGGRNSRERPPQRDGPKCAARRIGGPGRFWFRRLPRDGSGCSRTHGQLALKARREWHAQESS